MAKSRLRRCLVWTAVLALGLGLFFYGKPAWLLLSTWWKDRPVPDNLPPGYVDDASRMNATKVAEVWDIPTNVEEAEPQLQALLKRARDQGLRVSIAGARHSMGGHSIYPDGIVVNMLPFKALELDAAAGILHVGAGARWEDVIPYLDARGRSVSVMQATHNFSVGGSLSVNCHGWQQGKPPIVSTVESFRLMRADGVVVRCSRTENPDLFALAIGGYGLFGVILDVDLRVVPNERYRLDPPVFVSSKQYAARYREIVDRADDVTLAFGRLNVTPGDATFLREALLTVFRRSRCRPEEIPPLKTPGYHTLRRTILLAEIGSDEGKALRWSAEAKASKHIAGRFFSRNQLLNEDATLYQEHKAERTEILHEYFLPPARLEEFFAKLRVIVPAHHRDLLHVTLRDVRADGETFLRYADRDLIAVVMLFSQPRTAEGDSRMEGMTREMVDAALECGGRFYLPYRLHYTGAQLEKAYPRIRQFFEQKRRFDPDELFQNQFYRKYAAP
jgi:FAD/FMN-containing dehydrogenase